jgi:hypothetical protein
MHAVVYTFARVTASGYLHRTRALAHARAHPVTPSHKLAKALHAIMHITEKARGEERGA